MTGCLDGTRDSQEDPQWSVQEYWHDVTASADWQRSTPWATTGYLGDGIAVTATTMSSTYASTIVSNAGATKPFRDGVDTTAASNYEADTGSFTNATDVDSIGEITTLVDLTSPSPSTDSDSDGMSDAWETAEFGGLTQTAIGDYDSDGYDNIEEYFHYLAGAIQIPVPQNLRIE